MAVILRVILSLAADSLVSAGKHTADVMHNNLRLMPAVLTTADLHNLCPTTETLFSVAETWHR